MKKRAAKISQSLPYRPCVGVMLLNRQGLVFVGRRIDREAEETWQMPQGGIDDGENLEDAARRELREETGISSVETLAQSPEWYVYDLPEHLLGVALNGKYRGQRQKWFAMRFLGLDREIDLNAHHPEFDAWRWVRMSELPSLVVPFKRSVYSHVIGAFVHLAKDS
jgi:putative (di)nucleoside polyphosphate hydrolase